MKIGKWTFHWPAWLKGYQLVWTILIVIALAVLTYFYPFLGIAVSLAVILITSFYRSIRWLVSRNFTSNLFRWVVSVKRLAIYLVAHGIAFALIATLFVFFLNLTGMDVSIFGKEIIKGVEDSMANTIGFVCTCLLAGYFLFMLTKSFYSPLEGRIQGVILLNKIFTFIASIEGKRFRGSPWKKDQKGKGFFNEVHIWDIVDKEQTYFTLNPGKIFNVYFFLWPFFRLYTYEFTYTKWKKIGATKEDDTVIWEDSKTGRSIVSRSGISNFVQYQSEYPTVTDNLYTREEFANITVITNNTLLASNVYKMLFRVDNWLGITTTTINGALRGIISKFTLVEVNEIRSEGRMTGKGVSNPSKEFTIDMLYINKAGKKGRDDGMEELWGAKLTKSVFETFVPGNEQTQSLLDSFAKPELERQLGQAQIEKATREAKAYGKRQKAIVTWQKRFLVDTGLAKVDDKGQITELVPEANTRITTEAIKELAKLQGTLVLGGNEDVSTFLNVPATTKGKADLEEFFNKMFAAKS